MLQKSSSVTSWMAMNFISWISIKHGEKHPVTIPLPIILYSPQRGLTSFMSSKFHHGHEPHNGYRLLTEEYLEEMTKEGIDVKKEGLKCWKDHSTICGWQMGSLCKSV